MAVKITKDYITTPNIIDIREYSKLSDAVSAITGNATLVITEEYPVNEDVTVPENIKLKFEKGGSFNVGAGFTLTLNCPIEAGLYQIFKGSGNVTGNPKIECVYPEWFGAVGDGTTDDTNAIQKAIDFYKTKLIKQYLFNNLYIRNSISGNGKLILNSASTWTDVYFWIVNDNIIVEGITIEGVISLTYSLVRIEASDCKLIGVKCINHGGHGINVSNATNVIIRECVVDTVGHWGISVEGTSKSVKILNNTVSNCSWTNILVENGVEDVIIKGNITQSSVTNGIAVGNTPSFGETKNIVISNNISSNNSWSGIEIYDAQDIIIEGNQIYNNNSHGIRLEGQTLPTDKIIIQGNIIKDSGIYGIYMDVGTKNINIINNWIENVGLSDSTATWIDGIGINTGCDEIYIQNNTIKQTNTTYTMQRGVENLGGTNVFVFNNKITGYSSKPYSGDIRTLRVYKSPILDLDSGIPVRDIPFDLKRDVQILKAYAFYVEATSADAGITVVLKSPDGTAYFGYTTKSSATLFEKEEITLTYPIVLASKGTLYLACDNNKVGAGKVQIIIEYEEV